MAQPQAYNREVDFTERDGDDTNHAGINAEMDAAALSINQLRDNLALIQKDDGGLQPSIVTAESLAPSAFDAVKGQLNESVNDAQQAAASATLAANTATGARDTAVAARDTAVIANTAAQLNAQAAAASATAASVNGATAATQAIQQVYYGPLASDPAVDPLGNAPTAGDLYFNTSTSRLRVFNATTGTWNEGNAGSVAVQNLSGTGVQTVFALTTAPLAENNAQIYISGVYQQKDRYGISGTTLTFTTAPPAGTDNIEVVTLNTLPLGVTSADLVQFQQAGAGAVALSVGDVLNETVSVKRFGAVGDGVTDDTLAIQAALDYANTRSTATGLMVELVFPEGKYLRPNNRGALRPRGRVRLRGAGRSASVIYNNDSVLATRSDLVFASAADGLIDFELIDLGFEADWGVGNFTQRSHLVEVSVSGRAHVTGCHFANSRFMALIVSGADSVTVTDCSFFRTEADGCRATSCKGVTISNNTFDSVNDDCIAVHTKDSEVGPLDNFAVITGNRAVDSQGITVLGAKRTVIDSNVLVRPHTRGITVGTTINDPTEGNTASVGVTVTNNIIDTLFTGSVFFAGSGLWGGYINVSCIAPTTNGSGYVGQRNGAGGVVSPFPYLYTNNTDANAPAAGNWFVKIEGNQCIRTLAPAANYTAYGYGERYARGGPVNPAITSAELGLSHYQIILVNHAVGASIRGNTLWGGGTPIYLDGTVGSAYVSWGGVSIAENKIGNWQAFGLSMEGVGTLEVKNNEFDGDPLHVHSLRAANGTWANGSAMAPMQYEAGGVKAVVQGNTFKNVQALLNGPALAELLWIDNTLYANPTAEGWNAANVGIGAFVNPQRIGGNLVIEDGDPASATFGRVLNVCLSSSTGVPTSGKYAAGHFVKNATPSVLGTAGARYTVQGWTRLTYGSAHVLNTDWAEIRTLTGT